MSKTRVVVTGMGIICPIGNTVAEVWESLQTGRSGGGFITRFDTSRHKTKVAAEVKNYDPRNYFDAKEARRFDRFVQFSLIPAAEAVKDSGIDFDKLDRDEVGVVMGCAIGGIDVIEEQNHVLFEKGPGRVSALTVPRMISNMSSGLISIKYGLRGPNVVTTSACTSGTHSLGEAMHMIRRGDAKVIVAGGAEAAITPLSVASFENMGALTNHNESPESASRPFAKSRHGFLMGEGGAVLILEELEHAVRRGAKIYAELRGYGSNADAHHITAPSPDGSGAAKCMARALRDAGLPNDAIQYINAHGTSTELNDKMETMGIKALFGEGAKKLAVSSNKSQMGHGLGAAGSLEAVCSILAIQNQFVPATINLHDPDIENGLDLDYVPLKGRNQEVYGVLSNSFGFGGHNATVCITKFDK